MTTVYYIISSLLGIYSLAIWIRVILSWIPQGVFGGSPYGNSYYGNNNYGNNYYGGSSYSNTPGTQDRPVYRFLCRITDPYLNIFRKLKLRTGNLDWSVMLALMVLNILRSICDIAARTGTLTLGIVGGVIVQYLWRYFFSFILVLLLILLAVRWFMGRSTNPNSYKWVQALNRVLNAPVGVVFKLFYGKKPVAEQRLIGVSFIVYLVIYVGLRFGFTWLWGFLFSL